MAQREPPPEFFIDRSLGRRHLADARRVHGYVVRTLASVYGEQEGQLVADETWLAQIEGTHAGRGLPGLLLDAMVLTYTASTR